MGHFLMVKQHGLTINRGSGGIQTPVGPGHFETNQGFTIRRFQPVGVVEPHTHVLALNRKLPELRPRGCDFFSVNQPACRQFEPLADHLLQFKMGIGRIPHIVGNHHRRVFQFQGFDLRLPQNRPIRVLVQGGELSKQERKIPLLPGLSPGVNHGRK